MQKDNENTVSQLGGQAVFFLFGNIFTLVIGFPLQIYVARVLGAEKLGIFGLLEAGVGLLTGLLGFGLAMSLVKFIPQYLENKQYQLIKTLLRVGLIILAVTGIVAYCLVILSFPWIKECWPQIAEYQSAIVVMSLLIPLSLLVFFMQQGLRGFQEIRYMVFGTSYLQLTVKAALTILFFLLGYQLMGYIFAVAVSTFIALVWLGAGLYKKVSALPPTDMDKDQENHIQSWRSYAMVMYGNSLISLATPYLDRIILGFIAGPALVGVLIIVKQLQQLPVIFLQMFLTVVTPMFSAAHARSDIEERQHLYNLATDWIFRSSLPLFIFLLIFTEPLLALYGQEFIVNGKYALWILLIGQIVNLAFGPIGNLLNMCDMEKTMFRLNIYQTIIILSGFVLLIPILDLVGAAMSITLGNIFINIAAYVYARTQLKNHWWDKRYLKWILPAIITTLSGMFLLSYGPYPGPVSLIVYLAFIYIIFSVVTVIQGLHEDDRVLLMHILNQIKRVSIH